MQICIVAEHASTRFGGEAFLPLRYFSLLRSRGIDAWLVVHSRSRRELEELFPQDLDRIFFVPDLWIHKLVFAISRGLPRRVSVATFGLINQLITQFYQRSIVRSLLHTHPIDVIHQPIPISPRFPSAMFSMGIPVVIGPLNGGMDFPEAFRNNESPLSRAAVACLKLLTNAGNTLLPGKKHAAVLLVANERTRKALPRGVRGRVIEMNENGVDIGVFHSGEPNNVVTTNPLFLFVGRLVDWKALDIAIRALAEVPSANLEVIGDGPMLETWKTLAREVGVAERVRFLGPQAQPQYAARLRESVGLVLPSLYESGGAVVLEAMATAKPVIATRWGGPLDYLDSSCGILVEPYSYKTLVTGFAQAMQKLIDYPELAKAMGAAGRERAVLHFDWQRRIDAMVGIYDLLVKKPDIGPELKWNRSACPPALRHTQ